MHRLIVAGMLIATLGGCNMVSGLGKDLQAIGGAVSNTADSVGGAPAPPPGQSQPVQAEPPLDGAPAAPCVADAHGRLPAHCAH